MESCTVGMCLAAVLAASFLLVGEAEGHSSRPYSGEASYEKLRPLWARTPGQQTYLTARDARTKFLIYWNGAIRAGYVDRNNPGHGDLAELAPYQMTIEFGSGMPPFYELLDQDQVGQRLLDGYLPVLESKWRYERLEYTQTVFAKLFEAERVVTGREMTVAFARLRVRNLSNTPARTFLWLRLGLGDRAYRWDDNSLYDDKGRVRMIVEPDGEGSVAFHASYDPKTDPDNADKDNYNWSELRRKGYLSNIIKCSVQLEPRQSTGVYLKIPYFPLPPEKAVVLRNMDFQPTMDNLISDWKVELDRGMKIEVPEPRVNEVYKSNLMRIYYTGEMDPRTGLHHMKLHPGPRYVASSESNSAVVALDQRGYHKEAEQYLDAWLAWQGTNRPDGNVTSQEGCLLAHPDFEAVRWVSKHGQVLWMLCRHYKLSRDRQWLDRALPHLLKGADWIIRERTATKMLDEKGEKPITWGLMPHGQAGDYAKGNIVFTDAFNYAGLNGVAEILTEIGHPRAEELTRHATDYRDAIRTAVRRAVSRSVRVKLPSGEVIPWVPWELNTRALPMPTAAYGVDTKGWAVWAGYGDAGPQTLAWAGVFEPDEDIINWTLKFAEEYPLPIRFPGLPEPHTIFRYSISYSQPLYNFHTESYFWRDEMDKYVEAFYSLLTATMSPKTYVTLEHRQIPSPHSWHYSWGDGEMTMFIRRTLLAEKGNTLYLARGIPKAWLEDGKHIKVEDAPTCFGPMGYEIQSRIAEGRITATIQPPARNVPPGFTIKLRLRHPKDRPITRVTVNGADWPDFTPDTVTMPVKKQEVMKLTAEF